MNRWLSQQEASAALGIRRQTLYAYVSRGLIEVRPDPGEGRRNLYNGEDISALLDKRGVGRARRRIAASTMEWGEPSIATRVSTITRGRLYYRGHDAVKLSRSGTLESAAQLLWEAPERPAFPLAAAPLLTRDPRIRAYTAIGLAAAEGPPTHAAGPAGLLRDAAQIVGRLAGSLVGVDTTADPLHLRIARAWDREDSADLLRRALVLLADQELTTSAFAARVTASTGASLGAAALAGLAALSGPLHGDATIRVRALLEEVQRSGAGASVRRWLTSGQPLPGFGHPLYPHGDPRAAELLAAFEPEPETRMLIDCVRETQGLEPTIDVALAALAEACDLPQDAAFMLFAIGRSTGWMAHAMEQISQGGLIRPRAHYLGPPLEAGSD